MKLADIYFGLKTGYEQRQMRDRVIELCGVTMQTALNWCKGEIVPQNSEHRELLAAEYNTPAEELLGTPSDKGYFRRGKNSKYHTRPTSA